MDIDPELELEVEIILAKIKKLGLENLTKEDYFMCRQVTTLFSRLPPEVVRNRFLCGRDTLN